MIEPDIGSMEPKGIGASSSPESRRKRTTRTTSPVAKWRMQSVPLDRPLHLGSSISTRRASNKLIGIDDVRLCWDGDTQRAAEILRRLSRDPETVIREAVAASHLTPPDALADMLPLAGGKTLYAILENPNTPPHLLTEWAKSGDQNARAAVAGNPSTPPSELHNLLDDGREEVSTTLASNPSILPKTAAALLGTGGKDIRHALAKNPGLTLEHIQTLARHPDPATRAATVENPSCPEDIIALAAKDSDPAPRIKAAKTTSRVEVMRLLRKDEAYNVRKAVAMNPHLPTEMQWELLADRAPRLRLAMRHDLLPGVAKVLAKDARPAVRGRIATNLVYGGPAELSAEEIRTLAHDRELLPRQRAALGAHPACPADVVEMILKAPDPELRLRLPENPNLSPAQLEALLADPNNEVRAALAASRQTPADIAGKLLRDPVFEVREAAARGGAHSPEAIQEILHGPNLWLRARFVWNPSCTLDMLEALSRDPSRIVRYGVAKRLFSLQVPKLDFRA